MFQLNWSDLNLSFHVYIEPALEAKLDSLCKKTGEKRNAIVRKALREYVESRLVTEWPEDLFQFKPDKSLQRFESSRTEFTSDRDDIFA
jgi:hypothetical protein